jgi:nucleotide-binding universal stress UspA family protein
VTEQRRGGWRRIIHPTDFSPAGEAAFAQALEIAGREGAELVIVHVLEPISPFGDADYRERYRELRAALEAMARPFLDRLLTKAKRARVAASAVVAEGWPPEEIVKLARRRRADLIVIGTHGRSGVRRLLLGSVAERVIVLAPCPVLAVRAS